MRWGHLGSKGVPEWVREAFDEALASGLSPTAAATVAGVSGGTGRRWAKEAGYQADPRHCGTRYSAAVGEAFWSTLYAGASIVEAAVYAGVSENQARRWVAQAGYVPRTPVPADYQPCAAQELDVARACGPLTFDERWRLEQLLAAGATVAQAADALRRDRSTIYREQARGATTSGYRAGAGQDIAVANAKRPKTRKLDTNPALLVEVVARLKKHDSPAQIAGRLRLDFPDDPEMWVSHETIYQALYVQPRGELARLVKQALRSGRVQRTSQGRSTIDRPRFKDGMIGIAERPAEADDRAIPGHWESQCCCQAASAGLAVSGSR